MGYTSLAFLLFVSITALIYFLFPFKKNKWIVLLCASYFFYLYAGYKYVGFILITTLTTYITAIIIDRISKRSKEKLKINKAVWEKEEKKAYKAKIKTKKKLVMLGMLILNLGILAFLKYYNFWAECANDILGFLKTNASVPFLSLFLPLGISFYTFQSIGYVIDVYREKVEAERNVAKYALFVSFFPQIIQGPISFYDQLAKQLYQPHDFSFTRFKHACELIIWGFFKKLIIADRAVIAINTVLDNYFEYNGTTLLFTVLLYSLQLYADFSGGIDITRGVAQIFGINMAENFKRPYFAKSINEYWRRWHITLGAWMKDYVFYPIATSELFLGISKRIKKGSFGNTSVGSHIAKVLPTSIASFIVFYLVGIWHGANWKFVAFGVWNGGIIMLSTLLKPLFDSLTKKLKISKDSNVFGGFQIIRTFIIVLVGYVFDVAPDFSASMYTFKQFFVNQQLSEGLSQILNLGLSSKDFLILVISGGVLLTASIIQEKNNDTTIRLMLDKKAFIIRYGLLLLALIAILTFGVYGPQYDASAFVYMQF